MSLYTFILQFNGGTYISQVHADDEKGAMRIWLNQLDPQVVEGFTNFDKQRLIKEDFEDESPIPIDTCQNIWCFGIRTKKELGLVNFVLTMEN